RIPELILKDGFAGVVTLDSWMFLSSFVSLRAELLTSRSIDSLVHVGWNCFPQGHTYNRGVAFVIKNGKPTQKGRYINLSDVPATVEKNDLFLERLPKGERFYRLSQDDLLNIPDSVIAYWLSDELLHVYKNSKSLSTLGQPRQGLATADNDRFVRFRSEVGFDNIGIGLASREEARQSGLKWFPYNKGGEYRKWYGNQTHVVNWENDGDEIRSFSDENGKQRSRPQNTEFYFRESASWSKVTSAGFSLRYFPKGF